ncbi:MAG: OmpA family protein [bacterium]|jgi:peptidoglycan-associated lipoprotein
MKRQIQTLAVAFTAVVALSGCRKAQPEAPAPQPQQEQQQAEPTPPPPPPAQPAEDPAEVAARNRAILMEMIHFDFDRADIRPDAREILERKVPILRADPTIRLRIDGHADERGSVEYNLALGLRRANAAKQFLVGFGLDESRFETQTFGESRPLDPRSNEEAWAKNRRAEFHIIAGQLATEQQ